MAEIHKEFFASWDGRVLPKASLEHWLKHGDGLEDRSCEEYRGGEGTCEPDRFGPDNREVCAATCARRRCTGCCFCVGAPLPVFPQDSHWGAFAFGPFAFGGAFELQMGHSGARPTDGDSETASPRLPHAGCLVSSGCAGIPSRPPNNQMAVMGHRSG